MPKTYTITPENAKELREAMKNKTNSRFYRRLQAVALRGEGRSNEEIGKITGYNPNWVSELVSTYCSKGIDGILHDGRKGGNSRNMSDAEEKKFLSRFEEAGKNGQIITIAEIAAAYDEETGKKHASKSTVYYLLKKHGWRQITPQTAHPGKASEAEMEASKKLTKKSRK